MKRLLISFSTAGILGLGSLMAVGSAAAAGEPSTYGGYPDQSAVQYQLVDPSRLQQAVANGLITSAQEAQIEQELRLLRQKLDPTPAVAMTR